MTGLRAVAPAVLVLLAGACVPGARYVSSDGFHPSAQGAAAIAAAFAAALGISPPRTG